MNFYLSQPNRAIAINPAHVPGADALEDARPFDYKGTRLLGIPHDVGNTIALRQLGVQVPSPITTHYQFPRVKGRHKTREHQVRTADFLTTNPRSYVLNEIGTGKTHSALCAADYLMREGYVRRALILSPLSTLQRVWFDEIFAGFPNRSAAVLHGEAKKRRKLFAQDHSFYVINHDGLDILTDCTYDNKKRLVSAKLPRDDIDLIIIDEVAVYRYANTKRWELMRKVVQDLGDDVWVWGMTGTPTPNYPSDAYGQIRIVTPNRVPKFYGMFRQMVMQQVNQYKWIPRPEAMDTVYSLMQPAIRIARSEAVELPPCVYSEREVEFTTEQNKHFKEVFNEFVTTVESGQIVSAVNEGVKQSKLLQIACGVVYDREGAPVILPVGPRLEVTKQIIEEAGQKVIVFVPFTAVLDHVYEYLRKAGLDCARVNGQVSKNERDRIFSAFQSPGGLRVIVADAGCMSHGLTLTEASTIIWYGPEPSNDIYTQANGRITREGQRNVQSIIHIVGSSLERKIFQRLSERGQMQGILLELVKEATRARR